MSCPKNPSGGGHAIWIPWEIGSGKRVGQVGTKPHDVYPEAPEHLNWCQCEYCGEYVC